MTSIALVAGILATWRVTHLVVEEDGPWDVLRRIRRLLGGAGAARLVNCFYCASVWIAVVVALLLARGWRELVIATAAFSGGATWTYQPALPDLTHWYGGLMSITLTGTALSAAFPTPCCYELELVVRKRVIVNCSSHYENRSHYTFMVE